MADNSVANAGRRGVARQRICLCGFSRLGHGQKKWIEADRAAFVAELKKAGFVVESKGPVVQPFLSMQGQFMSVDGIDIQTFEYASETAAKTEAGKIAPDG